MGLKSTHFLSRIISSMFAPEPVMYFMVITNTFLEAQYIFAVKNGKKGSTKVILTCLKYKP